MRRLPPEGALEAGVVVAAFQMTRRDVLVGDGDRVAALTDGFATIRNVDYRWSTVGLYEVVDQQITACWLLPLDQRAFDAIWAF